MGITTAALILLGVSAASGVATAIEEHVEWKKRKKKDAEFIISTNKHLTYLQEKYDNLLAQCEKDNQLYSELKKQTEKLEKELMDKNSRNTRK